MSLYHTNRNTFTSALSSFYNSYFVLCKDFTLRRFHQSEEVDKPNAKTLKVYQISEFEAVVPDVPPRFFLRLKSKSVDKEGVVIKIAAEFETEKAEWVRELAKAIAECPKDIDDDPVRAALEDKKRKVSSGPTYLPLFFLP